jgi:PadR family transcriptional regulator PadR
MSTHGLGDFEQLVLLAVLQLREDAYAAEIRARIRHAAGRRVTRGALYATLDRLEGKHFLDWNAEDGPPARGGTPRRRFRVTAPGLAALKRSYQAVRNLSHGFDRLLREV